MLGGSHARGGHARRGPCQEGAMPGGGHVGRGPHWEGGEMLASSTSMPWPKISFANISDSKALGVRDHVRRGSC